MELRKSRKCRKCFDVFFAFCLGASEKVRFSRNGDGNKGARLEFCLGFAWCVCGHYKKRGWKACRCVCAGFSRGIGPLLPRDVSPLSGGWELLFQGMGTFYRGMGTSFPLNVLPAAAGEFRAAGGFRAASLLRAASPTFFTTCFNRKGLEFFFPPENGTHAIL